MGIHTYTDWLKPIEKFSDKALVPLYWLANIPSQLNAWGELILSDRSDLESENTRLNQENLIRRSSIEVELISLLLLYGALIWLPW